MSSARSQEPPVRRSGDRGRVASIRRMGRLNARPPAPCMLRETARAPARRAGLSALIVLVPGKPELPGDPHESASTALTYLKPVGIH
jgi:hypothetical protein